MAALAACNLHSPPLAGFFVPAPGMKAGVCSRRALFLHAAASVFHDVFELPGLKRRKQMLCLHGFQLLCAFLWASA